MVRIKEFAPVIIPTLNRYDHFRDCLESLERCTWAEKTDVYVGLDYPPSEKYVEGWQKIDGYLYLKESNHRFRNLIVRRRDHNCGVLKDGSNDDLLIKEVCRKYDRYIFTEDDNIFSPCFLDFVNQALSIYYDDKRITMICGFTHKEYYNLGTSNILCGKDAPAYGMGCWRSNKEYLDLHKYEWIFKDLKRSKLRCLKLFIRQPALVYMLISMIWSKTNSGDLRQFYLNIVNDTYSICPSVSMVRNMGCDGSGLHSGFVDGLSNQEILHQDQFELDKIEIGITKEYAKRCTLSQMPKNYIIRQFSFVLKLLIVLVFLFLDKRNNADEPQTGLLKFVNWLWYKAKVIKYRFNSKHIHK